MQQRTQYSSQPRSWMNSVSTSGRPESSWTRTSSAWARTGWISGTTRLFSSPSAAQPRCVLSARSLHVTQRDCCRCCPCCTWTRWWLVYREQEADQEPLPRSGPAELYHCCAPNRSGESLWRYGVGNGWRPPCRTGHSDELHSHVASRQPTGPEKFLEREGGKNTNPNSINIFSFTYMLNRLFLIWARRMQSDCLATTWHSLLCSIQLSASLCSSMGPLGTVSYVGDVSVQNGAMDV